MSATDELRRMLDERGVEYTANERDTQWWPKDNPAGVLAENSRYPHGTLDVYGLAPEQAIAATLGLVNAGRYVGLRQGEYWERTENSDYYCGGCGWKVTDHDSYCPECGGALHKAALGSCNCTNSERTVTCTADETEHIDISWQDGRHLTIHVMECSECGRTYEHVNGGYEFCPRCGRRIEVNDG